LRTTSRSLSVKETLEGEVEVAAVAELPGTMPAEFRFPECFILSVGNIRRSVGLVDFTPEGVEP
jgi:hypothetical protein